MPGATEFKKGQKRGPGRPKGLQNKITLSVKQALIEAFELNGGVRSLAKFAKDNPAAFYGIWGRLAPREITGGEGGPLRMIVTFERESRKSTAG